MHRMRRTWLALMAGALLVTLSVSTAFAAAPSGTREATRGQTIAAMVHELIFGSDETQDDTDEEQVEEDEELVEEEDEVLDEDELVDEEEDEEQVDEEENEEADSHGACVSAAAQDHDGSAESELKNHGKWVSQHARYTCWGLDVPTDEADDDVTDEEEETSDVDDASAEVDDDGGKANKPDKADRADRGTGKPSWAGNGNGGNGKPAAAGNGRGGGRR
jgi:hypothetical protein